MEQKHSSFIVGNGVIMKDKQVVQVGMCPILNWPNDYNWSDTDKHKCYGGRFERYSGLGGVGDEIAMRMFFQPYTQYKAIKEKYPHLSFRHYSIVHPRDYDSSPLFNAGTVFSLYENNPYIDELSYIEQEQVKSKDYFKDGLTKEMQSDPTAELQWFLKCVDLYMKELQEEYGEIPIYDIVSNEVFEEDVPTLYLGDENELWAVDALKDLPRPLIGLQINKTANNIIEFLSTLGAMINDVIGECTIVCVGTTKVPRRWLLDNMVSFSGTTSLLQCVSLIDNLDVCFCMFSGLMYSSFIRQTPAVIWAEQEKDDNCLGHVSWYSKNLPIDPNLNRFLIGDTMNMEKVAHEISEIVKTLN